ILSRVSFMRVVFLGTNGWYDTETGNTTCTLVEAGPWRILLDAGNGIRRLEGPLGDPDHPCHLFLSHFHIDHVAGLHVLGRLSFPGGLSIWGQPGTRETLATLLAPPFTVPCGDLPFPVRICDLAEGAHRLPFPVTCRYLPHASPCFGYRFELEGRIIAYCTDTGPSDTVIELARDADLLIAESALRPGTTSDDWPHLNPEMAVALARSAGARRLSLTHFDAWAYRTLEERTRAGEEVRESFPDLTIATDGLVLDL
ncbi:MAG TPA: ribonuclease Z, partial [Methanomicrobiales archaeon]|nr:ribonuclease Z [Methanomicrobiales archaeon]